MITGLCSYDVMVGYVYMLMYIYIYAYMYVYICTYIFLLNKIIIPLYLNNNNYTYIDGQLASVIVPVINNPLVLQLRTLPQQHQTPTHPRCPPRDLPQIIQAKPGLGPTIYPEEDVRVHGECVHP